jgi:SAM-dependent methyltransferase
VRRIDDSSEHELNRSASTWEQAVDWLRQQTDQRALVEAAYYDDPLLLAAMRYHASEEWSAIKNFLPTHDLRALDVGAGRGIASYALAKEGYEVVALEPDESGLVGTSAIRALASESGVPIDVYCGFSEQLPFPNSQFGLVFARSVLHHARDLQKTCDEMFRVLRPGGTLLAVREHVISKPNDLQAFLDAHPLHKMYGGENAFLLRQYEEAIRVAGFQIDRVLSPFESPINFAPHTIATLRAELARRLSFGAPRIAPLAESLLSVPGVWSLICAALKRIDHRPGRLYSFVCRRL